MIRSKDGTYRARIQLDPGNHQFKFFVDGDWQPDPTTEQWPNHFGTTNSIIRVA